MVNKTFILKLKQNIDDSKYFGSNDFSITEEYGNLNVNYNYTESYFFELKIPSEMSILSRTEKQTNSFGILSTQKEYEYQQYEFSGRLSPGKISETEHFHFEGEAKVLTYLNNWLNNLWNELTFAPELRKLNDFDEEIQKINEKFNNVSADYFSKDEITNLIEKLEILENQFIDKLESEIKDKEALQEVLEDLHKEIEKLKGQSKVLNKRNWFKSFGGKIFKWVSKEENRKFLHDTSEFIRPLLPDSIKVIL